MTSLAWKLLQQVFTVETLMTPRENLLAWERGTDLSRVLSEAKRKHFDIVPVTDGNRIDGVLRTKTEQLEPLTAQWLVSHDTGIPDLLTLFVQSERPAFFVFHRQDVVGLVALADLNKLPARVYFYNLIGKLELTLAARIRNHFPDNSDQPLQVLSKKRRKDLRDKINELVEGNADVDPVQLLRFSDLINIVAKREKLRSELGFHSRNAAENALGGLNDLRNRTMHLVRPLLERVPKDLLRLHKRLEAAEDVLRKGEN